MVVAAPAGAVGRLDLEDVVDDLQRVDDERIVGAADAVAHEFEEAGVDDLARLEVVLLAGGAVGDVDGARAACSVVMERLARAGGRMRM